MNANTHIAAPQEEVYWRYEMPPNRGAKVQLLTIGGISVTGTWYGAYGQYLMAWAPMLKRDKQREQELQRIT